MEISKNHDLKRRIDQWVNETIKNRQETFMEEMGKPSNFHYPSLDETNFTKLLTAMAEIAIRKRRQHHPFLIDENNRQVIHQMWLWVTASEQCQWNVNKGIYLGGKIGCGKTILMTAFCEVLQTISKRYFVILPAKDLYSYLQKYGANSLNHCPLFIDELGREQVENTDYGNRIRPFVDVMERRYETGEMTMITSNFHISTLSKETDDNGRRQSGYGEYIKERVQEMMNMVILPGSSRRDLWNDNKPSHP